VQEGSLLHTTTSRCWQIQIYISQPNKGGATCHTTPQAPQAPAQHSTPQQSAQADGVWQLPCPPPVPLNLCKAAPVVLLLAALFLLLLACSLTGLGWSERQESSVEQSLWCSNSSGPPAQKAEGALVRPSASTLW